MQISFSLFSAGIATVLLSASSCAPSYKGTPPVVGLKDSPESQLGERIFREPRFSKYFVRQSGGDPNARPAQGDPALARVSSPRRGELDGPFAGQAMSCVACHMVEDGQMIRHGGMRGYTDFSQRSPIPHLASDDLTTTPRNAPTLIGSTLQRSPFLLHFDGEFATVEDLILGSYVGRNFGWLPGEEREAMANIVRVIRQDDGHDALAARFGKASYRTLLLGEDRSIPRGSRLPKEYRMDIDAADDQAVLDRVVSLVKAYLEALQFSRDAQGDYNGSAYDHFLAANHLPNHPDEGESDQDYAGRLSVALQNLTHPEFIHDDAGDFGPTELVGARIFLARSTAPTARSAGYFQVGNCVACHAPPHFTDFKFHNTGETQDEYDSIHGEGAFASLLIPDLAERMRRPEAYLPATDAHPNGSGRFRRVPSADHPEYMDLGAWNIFENPDFPAPQAGFSRIFCPTGGCATDARKEAALFRAIATFKTPGLRGLSLSDPYLHTGRKPTIPDVLRFYRKTSELERGGLLRNGDPELTKIRIDDDGADALAAFLNSLNEDYE